MSATLEATWTQMGDTVIVTDADEPNTRYVVWLDDYVARPLDYWEGASVVQYAGDNSESPDDATGALGAFFRHYAETGDDDAALRFAQRYARAFQTGETIDTRTLRGHSQSHWTDAVFVTQKDAGAIESYADEYAQWFRGDVYVVMAEYATECDRGQVHWETVNDQGIDSTTVGGIYADTPEDAVSQYLEQV